MLVALDVKAVTFLATKNRQARTQRERFTRTKTLHHVYQTNNLGFHNPNAFVGSEQIDLEVVEVCLTIRREDSQEFKNNQPISLT